MALVNFTNAEVVKIRRFTGRPASPRRDRFALSVWGDIESAIAEVDPDIDKVTEVRAVLTQLASIETEMAALHGFAVMGQAEELQLNADRYRDLRTAGRRECAALAALFGLKVYRDPYSAGGWAGGGFPVA